MAKATNDDAVAQLAKQAGAETMPLTKLRYKDSLTVFINSAASWHRASVHMVASGTVCLLVGSHSNPSISSDQTMATLRERVSEKGIKQAQIYKYLGLSLGLSQHLVHDDKMRKAVVNPLIEARSVEDAVGVLITWMQKRKLLTLDSIGVLLGKYQRTEAEADTEEDTDEEDVREVNAPPVQPTKATPAAITARIVDEPEVLNDLTAQELVKSYIQAGNKAVDIISAAVPYLRLKRDCQVALRKLEARLAQMAAKEQQS